MNMHTVRQSNKTPHPTGMGVYIYDITPDSRAEKKSNLETKEFLRKRLGDRVLDLYCSRAKWDKWRGIDRTSSYAGKKFVSAG